MKKQLFTIIFLLLALGLNAQIGYQVSLLDAATGQPRADETVSVRIDLTDSTGAIICSETKTATSDDFGVLSLTVGNASTFENFDWSRLPLYISATVDDVLLGKSQVLNVPVAEYAKKTGTLTKEILMSKTWKYIESNSANRDEYLLNFNDSKATLQVVFHPTQFDPQPPALNYYKYKIIGDFVLCYNGDVSNLYGSMIFAYTGFSLIATNYPEGEFI